MIASHPPFLKKRFPIQRRVTTLEETMRSILALAIVAMGMVGAPLMAAATSVIGPVTSEVFIKKPTKTATQAKPTPKKM